MESRSSKSLLSIPEPCQEDWGQMTAAERGRYCGSCQKVVRDFTGMARPDIERELIQSPATCGRFQTRQLDTPELPAEIFFRYPLQRLRRFLVAFLLVFGFEAFGFTEATAQQLSTELGEAQESGQLKVQERGIQQEEIHLEGIVLDAQLHTPVPYATIMVKSGGKVIAGVLSNQEGRFQLDFSLRDLDAYHYDLAVSYTGRERMRQRVETDIEEVLVLIDPTVLLEEVKIHESLLYDNSIVGAIERTTTTETVGLISVGYTTITERLHKLAKDDYYHDLNPFLMMRNSEINMSNGESRF